MLQNGYIPFSTKQAEILCEDSVMKKSILKVMRSIEVVIPGMRVARCYQRRWLWADLFAGLTIFAMLVPQGMAYGELAGVAPLFFANADHFIREVQELIDAAYPTVEWLLVDAEAIIDIDVTAAEALSELQHELAGKEIVLAIAVANHPLQHMLKRAGLTERIGSAYFFPTVRTAVQAYLAQQTKQQ